MHAAWQSSEQPVPAGALDALGRRQNGLSFLLVDGDDRDHRFAQSGRGLRLEVQLQALIGRVDVGRLQARGVPESRVGRQQVHVVSVH